MDVVSQIGFSVTRNHPKNGVKTIWTRYVFIFCYIFWHISSLCRGLWTTYTTRVEKILKKKLLHNFSILKRTVKKKRRRRPKTHRCDKLMAAAEKWGQNKTENLSRGVTAANPFILYISGYFLPIFFLSEMKLFSAPENVNCKSLICD